MSVAGGRNSLVSIAIVSIAIGSRALGVGVAGAAWAQLSRESA